MSPQPADRCIRALQRQFGDRLIRSAELLEPYARDFGAIVCRVPAVVLRPQSVADVVTALSIAADHRTSISTRGSGHSVSGQSLVASGIVLDMTALDTVAIDRATQTAWLGAGATWKGVADDAFAHGLMPVGLTMIADVTVGGTLSVGGIGAESFRTATQSDQVLELEVATLHGRVERCSPYENRELYDCMRAGLGQCGIITQACYPLRAAKPRVRTYTFVYHEPAAWLSDIRECARDQRADFVFGGLVSEGARWLCILMLGKEFARDSELDDNALRRGLRGAPQQPTRDDPLWSADGLPGHRFFRIERGNHGTGPHPWVDHVCDLELAARLVSDVIERPPVGARRGITAGLGCIAGHPNAAPLFARPTSQELALFSLLTEPSAAELQQSLEYVCAHSARGCALGGKRYVYGFFDDWSAAQWAQHYGEEQWARFASAKRAYDPEGLLNAGCLAWS